MKTYNIIKIVVLSLLLVNCDRDDDGNSNTFFNRAPNAFDLVEVKNQGTNVELLPTFKWDAAKDPDGDTVTYDLYVSVGDEPEQKIASNLSSTNFSANERLDMNRPHAWYVVAKDRQGSQTKSEIFNFTTRSIRATRMTQNADFSPRSNHATVVFHNTLYLMSGRDSDGPIRDLWKSDPDLAFVPISLTDNTFPENREGHTLNVFMNQLVCVGGRNGNNRLSDFSLSPNGQFWNTDFVTDSLPPLFFHNTVVYKEQLMIMDGYEQTILSVDEQGNMQTITQEAAFGRLEYATLLNYDGKLWIIGGADDNDGLTNRVWSSEDGQEWSLVTPNAQFLPRLDHTSVVFDDKMWVIGGGIGVSSGRFNDIWYSKNGKDWYEATPTDENFSARTSHTTAIFNDRMVLIGGKSDDNFLNDVWVLE